MFCEVIIEEFNNFVATHAETDAKRKSGMLAQRGFAPTLK